eukprot:gene6055-4355_t
MTQVKKQGPAFVHLALLVLLMGNSVRGGSVRGMCYAMDSDRVNDDEGIISCITVNNRDVCNAAMQRKLVEQAELGSAACANETAPVFSTRVSHTALALQVEMMRLLLDNFPLNALQEKNYNQLPDRDRRDTSFCCVFVVLSGVGSFFFGLCGDAVATGTIASQGRADNALSVSTTFLILLSSRCFVFPSLSCSHVFYLFHHFASEMRSLRRPEHTRIAFLGSSPGGLATYGGESHVKAKIKTKK